MQRRIEAVSLALWLALVALLATPPARAGYPYAYPVGPCGGDTGGTYPNCTVTGLQNHALPAPSGTNTVPTWSGSALSWQPSGSGFSVSGTGFPVIIGSTLQTTAYTLGGESTSGTPSGGAVPVTNLRLNSFTGPSSPPDNGSWSQATWYLDPASTIATCNDATNTGLSSSSPLCTCQEMQRRLGTTSPMWQQNTSIVWDSSQVSTSDRCDLGNPSNFQVTVSGALNTNNQIFSNTISAFTSRNQTTGALYTIAKVTGMAVGTLVYNSTRASYAVVHSISGSTATLSEPMTTAGAEDNGWANGNAIVGYAPYTAWYSVVDGISSPISISNLVIGTSANGNANLNAYGQVSLTNLSFLADVVFGLQNSPDDTDAEMINCFSNNDVTNQTTSSIYVNSGSTSTNVTVLGGDIAEFFGSFTLSDDVIAANRGSNLPHNVRNGVLDGVYIDSGATILSVGTTTASTWVWGLGSLSNSGILSYTATGDAVFEPTVTLSFGIGGTSITTACSLSASAGQPCNVSLTAANLSATAGASGFGDYAFLPGGELYARAGTAPPSGITASVLTTLGTAGQALFTNAAANAIAWASCSGDLSCSTSTPGSYTVNSISGSSPVVINSAATLEWAKGVSSPTLTQAAPTSDVATQALTIESQAPFASASTNKSAGPINLSIPATVGAGTTYGSVNFLYSGSIFGGISPVQGVTAGGYAIYLNESGFGSGNYALASTGSGSGAGLQVNSPGFSGTTLFSFAANSGHSANINGFQIGSSTPSLGGGTNILGIENASTNPSSCPGTSTGSIMWVESGFVYGCFGSSTREQIAGSSVSTYGTGATSFTAHGVILGEGTSALSVTGTGTSGQPLLSGGSSADPAYGALALNSSAVSGILPYGSGGTGASGYTTNGAIYAQASSLNSTAAPTGTDPLLGASGGVPTFLTPGQTGYPAWHTTTYCASGCTFTSSGSTYTPVTSTIFVHACGAGGGGGAGPNGTSSAGIGNPPDGGGGAGANGPTGAWTLSVTAGTAITVNFGSGGSGGTVASPTANNGGAGGTSSMVQSSSTIWSLFGGAGGTGGNQANSLVNPIAAGGGPTTGGAGYAPVRYPFAIPPTATGYGGYGGGQTTGGTVYQASAGTDALACSSSVASCEGGAGGAQGTSDGGFGGGGGSGSYFGAGDPGERGGVGVSSGTGGNASITGTSGATCAGGGAGAAGGASQSGTGGNGSPGHPGGGAWIQISEWYRFLDAAADNDNARPWKVWARARAANEI